MIHAPYPSITAAVQPNEPCASGAVLPDAPVHGQKSDHRRPREDRQHPSRQPTGAIKPPQPSGPAAAAATEKAHAAEGTKSNLQGREKTR